MVDYPFPTPKHFHANKAVPVRTNILSVDVFHSMRFKRMECHLLQSGKSFFTHSAGVHIYAPLTQGRRRKADRSMILPNQGDIKERIHRNFANDLMELLADQGNMM